MRVDELDDAWCLLWSLPSRKAEAPNPHRKPVCRERTSRLAKRCRHARCLAGKAGSCESRPTIRLLWTDVGTVAGYVDVLTDTRVAEGVPVGRPRRLALTNHDGNAF